MCYSISYFRVLCLVGCVGDEIWIRFFIHCLMINVTFMFDFVVVGILF